MKDLKLNYNRGDSTQYGDLEFTEDGNLIITDSIIQAITMRLRWFAGEFKYNTNYGIPYYEDVFVKNANMNLIKQDLAEAIQTVSEVDEIVSLDLSPVTNERKLTVKFTVKIKGTTESGEAVILG